MIANYELNLAENQCTVLLFCSFAVFEGKSALLRREKGRRRLNNYE